MKTELTIDMGELDWTPKERAKARHIVATDKHREQRQRIADKYRRANHAGQNDH
jgi:hypothetical protein